MRYRLRMRSANQALWLGVGLLAALVPFASPATEPTLPLPVRDALTHTASQLSPITISWTRQFSGSSSREQAQKDLRLLKPDLFFAKQSFRLSCQNGSIYVLRSEENQCDCEYAFDGNILYSGRLVKLSDGTPRPELSKSLVSDMARSGPGLDLFDANYFELAGLLLRTTAEGLAKKEGPQSLIFSLLDKGARLRNVQDVHSSGQTLVRVALTTPNADAVEAVAMDLAKYEEQLRKGGNSEAYIQAELRGLRKMRELPKDIVQEFYLDPQLGYAVVRREQRYEDGKVVFRVTYDDFRRVDDRDLWLPYRCKKEFYTYDTIVGEFHESPIVQQDFIVSEVDLRPLPVERFKLIYTVPGTLIFDMTLPGPPLQIDIPVSLPKDLDKAVADARAAMGQPNPSNNQSADTIPPTAGKPAFWTWVALGFVIFVVLVVGFAVLARRRTGAQ